MEDNRKNLTEVSAKDHNFAAKRNVGNLQEEPKETIYGFENMLVRHKCFILKQNGRLKDASADDRCARRRANHDVCNGDWDFECVMCGVSTMEDNGNNTCRRDDSNRILKTTTNMLDHGCIKNVLPVLHAMDEEEPFAGVLGIALITVLKTRLCFDVSCCFDMNGLGKRKWRERS